MGLLELFDRERARLWTQVEALGEKHSGLSGLLSRDGDSRMAYLVEAASYGVARLLEHRSDDSLVTDAIVGPAMPSLLRPTPAMTIVRRGASDTTNGTALPAGQILRSIPVQGHACEFRTTWPITSSSLTIASVAFEMRGPTRQVLRLRLATSADLPLSCPSSLRLFAKAREPLHALDVVRAVCTGTKPVRVAVLDEHGRPLRANDAAELRIHVPALSETLELFPGRRDAFESLTLTHALFAFPEVFCFVDIEGLGAYVPPGDKSARFLELEIPLVEPLPDHADSVTFELGCAPAINVRSADAHVMDFAPPTTRLRLESLPGTELYDVDTMRMQAPHLYEGTEDICLWDREYGHVMRREEVQARVHRRPALREGPSECDLELLPIGTKTIGGMCSVTATLLLTDGVRTLRLAQGDITGGAAKADFVNITRVTPYRPFATDRDLPWRANGLARITAADFATDKALRRFLEVFDVTRSSGSRNGRGIATVTRKTFRCVVLDRVHGGDAVDVTFAPSAFGGMGATWLIGEILSRAFVERTDALRYSHVRWVERNRDDTVTVRADYGRRPGERLPFPFS